MIIAFLDFEASALENGYPIEVGYARSDGLVGSSLIKPREEWLDLNWSAASERIHRLPRSILNHGLDADEAFARLNVELQGCACFSTAPAFDWSWLRMLNPGQSVDFRLMQTPADSVLMAAAEESGISGPVAARIVDRAKRLGNHEAARDAVALAAAHEILSRPSEIRMKEVAACFRRWQSLAAAAAAAWRSG